MNTRVYDASRPDERSLGIDEAVSAVLRGELIVLPTDTVYGVAADAFSSAAVDALLAAKGRDRSMPVPVLVASQPMVEAIVDDLPDAARALIERFWPGALTLVVRHTTHLAWDLGETKGTVAVRMPDSEIALEVISRTGPLATSSANRTGHPPAATMLDARLQLGASVSVYLDGGPTGDPVASSIVDLTGDTPRLLRAGAIDLAGLQAVVPELIGLEPEGQESHGPDDSNEPELDDPELDDPELDDPEPDEPEFDEPELDEPELDEPELDDSEPDEPEPDHPEL